MNQKTNEELQTMAEKATAGDREALEVTLVQDIFNSSARISFSTFWVTSGTSCIFPFSMSYAGVRTG